MFPWLSIMFSPSLPPSFLPHSLPPSLLPLTHTHTHTHTHHSWLYHEPEATVCDVSAINLSRTLSNQSATQPVDRKRESSYSSPEAAAFLSVKAILTEAALQRLQANFAKSVRMIELNKWLALNFSNVHYCDTCVYIYIHVYKPCSFDVTIEIRPFIPDNVTILSGKKIVRFYTISEMQAARNF